MCRRNDVIEPGWGIVGKQPKVSVTDVRRRSDLMNATLLDEDRAVRKGGNNPRIVADQNTGVTGVFQALVSRLASLAEPGIAHLEDFVKNQHLANGMKGD
jgi:hypothetical protein